MVLLTGVSAWSWAFAAAADAGAGPYYLRNLNPFLQVFGLPAPEGGELTPAGRLSGRLLVDVANHADADASENEAVSLDGESYYSDLVLRYGIAERWEVGLDLPYVSHRKGHLDNLIEGWHDLFGLSNSDRQGPSNELRINYREDDVDLIDISDGSGGIGDVRVSAAYRLGMAGTDRSLALRTQVKLPTGDADELRGSGATDVAVALDASDRQTLAGWSIDLFGQFGLLRAGKGDVLTRRQEEFVPFASLGMAWHWTDALRLQLQFSAQDRYFDSAVDQIGGMSVNVAVGGGYEWRRSGLALEIALVEDLVSDATPDFGLQIAIRRAIGRTDE